MPVLHLLVGLPCSGKTTLAKELESETGALRLTPDDWHRVLFGQDATHPEHDARHARIEALQWQVAARSLQLGVDVILDFGLWSVEERDDFRARAAALGAEARVHFLDPPFDELLARLDARNRQPSDEVTIIPPEHMVEYRKVFQPPTEEELALNSS